MQSHLSINSNEYPSVAHTNQLQANYQYIIVYSYLVNILIYFNHSFPELQCNGMYLAI